MRPFWGTVLFVFGLAVSAVSFGAGEDWRGFVGSEKLALLDSVKKVPADFYVSPDGNDAWSGRLAAPNGAKTDGPFRSPEKARDAARRQRAGGASGGGPTVIELQPGLYEREGALVLTGADSGSQASPVIWRGVCGEQGRPLAVFRGGRTITGGKKVRDAAVLGRLKPEAREKVLEYDLKALGITDYGTLDGTDDAELFLDDRPMTPARYPNGGFMKFERVDEENNPPVVDQGNRGVAVPKLYAEGGDAAAWAAEPDLWAFGYWFWDWASGRQRVIRIDPEKKMIELDKPYHPFGYRPGRHFYVYHALCELDSPGEYYLDRGTGKLYFFPPEVEGDGALYLSTAGSLVEGTGLEHAVFSGIGFEGCRHEGIRLEGSDLLICGCLIRGTGGDGVRIAGDRHLLFGNLLYNTGGHGFVIDSGDQLNLRPGKSAAVNNDFHHFGRIQRVYAPAIRLSGCGDMIAQNRISDAPHCGIFFSGNDQRIERNEICSVCQESNDAGAVYTGGNWTMRGNTIRQNYLHNMSGFRGDWCVGVYLDDMFSSADISENLFVKVKCAVMIGGGRDNRVANNLFVKCRTNLHLDARGLGWAHRPVDQWLKEIDEKGTISGVEFRSSLWAEKYPRLAAIADGVPGAPEGNLIERNLVIPPDAGVCPPTVFEGDAVEEEARRYITVRNNLAGDMRLLLEVNRGESAPLPGTDAEFKRIPVEKIGIFDDPNAVSR